MAIKHQKSLCCKEKIIHFGGKRRQCVKCRKTWSLYQKKRGRKRHRVSLNLISEYFSRNIPNIRTLAKRRSWGRDRAQRLLIRSLKNHLFLKKDEWQKLLSNKVKLIAIADALWHRVDGKRITIYVIFLRPINKEVAVICPPIFVSEHENRFGWETAFLSLPESILSSIVALVCDGHTALVAIGRKNGWLVQRCHFHLIANLQMYLGPRRSPRSIAVISIVRRLITSLDKKIIEETFNKIQLIHKQSYSRGTNRVLGGLLTNYQDFQTYLIFPELNLPATTNVAESCMSGLRGLLRQCRGFRSQEAMQNWITGYILWKQTIKCNGKHQQN